MGILLSLYSQWAFMVCILYLGLEVILLTPHQIMWSWQATWAGLWYVLPDLPFLGLCWQQMSVENSESKMLLGGFMWLLGWPGAGDVAVVTSAQRPYEHADPGSGNSWGFGAFPYLICYPDLLLRCPEWHFSPSVVLSGRLDWMKAI